MLLEKAALIERRFFMHSGEDFCRAAIWMLANASPGGGGRIPVRTVTCREQVTSAQGWLERVLTGNTASTSRGTELNFPTYVCRIRSAAFSAITIAGALVLPPIRVGMMEASTTRSDSSPCTFKVSSTTAMSSLPILQVPTG